MGIEEYYRDIIIFSLGFVGAIILLIVTKWVEQLFRKKEIKKEILNNIYDNCDLIIKDILSPDFTSPLPQENERASDKFVMKDYLSDDIATQTNTLNETFKSFLNLRHSIFYHILEIVEKNRKLIQQIVTRHVDMKDAKYEFGPREFTISLKRKPQNQRETNDIAQALFQQQNPIELFEDKFGITDDVIIEGHFGTILRITHHQYFTASGKEALNIFNSTYNDLNKIICEDKDVIDFWELREDVKSKCEELMNMIEEKRK